MTLTEEVQTEPVRPAGLGPLGWARWSWRLLTSMRTALILLFLFALASVPGSIYPQRSISPDKVAQYFKDSPGAAKWLDRLWLFDVFTSPWFAATYLLLFISLAGCVVPRVSAHLRELRRKPPAAPKNLSRLPQHASFTANGATVEEIAAPLKSRRFRTVTGPGWVAAEKGYLRETGNLLFHTALLALLIAVGAGGLYGYRGNVLLVEGNGFANTVAAYDRYIPGQRVSSTELEPFSFTLENFQASYATTGDRRGQPIDFSARLRVSDHPTARERVYDLRVNEPLEVNGTQTYLLGHGYAPTFKIMDGKGQVAFEGPVPCLTADQMTYTSECVVKVPDAEPTQLGFLLRFLPSTVMAQDGSYASIFPGAANPTVQVFAFSGDLGMKSGQPQSVYRLDTTNLKPLVMGTKIKPLAVGETLPLPGGAGSIQLTGVREWISLQVAYDPGRFPALLAAALAVAGLVLSLTVRRRRVFARVREAEGEGPAVVELGGLTRTEGDAGFAEEFSQIVTALKGPEAGETASRQGVKDAH